MPEIFKIIQYNFIKIIIWENLESTFFLSKKINFNYKNIYKYLNNKKKKEFLTIRCILQKMNFNKIIYYNNIGKPYIDKNNFISLSHSYKMTVMGFSKFPIGIDIEKIRNKKIFYIKKKFIRNDENIFINPKMELYYLHIIWGIKESLYKLYNKKLYNFLKNYKVCKFYLTDKIIKCFIYDKKKIKKFLAFYKIIKKYFFIYILDNKNIQL